MMRGKSRYRGALLVEALIAFFLMFCVSLAVFGLQAQARKAKSKARASFAATAFAREVLEDARAIPYDNLSLGKETFRKTLTHSSPQSNGVIRLEAEREVKEGPVDALRLITIRVSWSSGQVSLEGFVGK